jgi:LDH2 family malate/lactate/ureidoglycolate dehydrogenase
MEWESKEKKLRTGVPIAPAVWKDLQAVAEQAGVPLPSTV